MIKFKFNELNDMEDIAVGKNLEKFGVNEIVNMLARYNLFIRNLDYEANRQSIKSFIDVALTNVDMNKFANSINLAVKKASDRPIINIEEIIITKNELDVIKSLNDIKQEKILFVILAVAKYNYALYDGKHGYTMFCKYIELFKMARVTVPMSERPYFMQFATLSGLVEIPNSPKSISLKPKFIDEDGTPELILKERDFKDLAYTYLAYKNPRDFRRCTTCGGYFKKSKNLSNLGIQKCKDCSTKTDDKSDIKSKICELCGRTFFTSMKDNVSKLCEDCYLEHRRKNKTETMRKLRAKNENDNNIDN